MWKRIGIRGDGSPQQPAGKVQASPLSTSREKYARKLPLNEESLHKRDLSSSRISEHSGRLIKMTSESSVGPEGLRNNAGSRNQHQSQAVNKTEQSAGKAADAKSTTSIKSGKNDTKHSDPATKEESPSPKKIQPRPSLKSVSATDRPSGSNSARNLLAQADAKPVVAPVTASYGAENATNEYIEMLDRKRKEAETKNIRYEMKLEQMKKLQTECSEIKKDLANLKKTIHLSQSDFEKRFQQETTKKIEDEVARRSKLEQQILRQTQQERDELRAKLKAQTEKCNNLKQELEQAKTRMQSSTPSQVKQLPQTVDVSHTETIAETTKPANEESVTQPLQKTKPVARQIERTSPSSAKEQEKSVAKAEVVQKASPSVKEPEVKQPEVKQSEVKQPIPVVTRTVIGSSRPIAKPQQSVVQKNEPAIEHSNPPSKEPLKDTTPIVVSPARTRVEAKVPNPEQQKQENVLQKSQISTTSTPVIQRTQIQRTVVTRNAVPAKETPQVTVTEAKTISMAKREVRQAPEQAKPVATVVTEAPKEVIKITKVPETVPAQVEAPPAYEDSISTILGAISKMKSSITELSSCKQSLQEKAAQPEATKTRRVITRTQKISSP